MTASADPACEGTKVYTFTYTDCAGNSAVWTYTYTIDIPAFTISTPNGASTVNCLAMLLLLLRLLSTTAAAHRSHR